MEDLIKKVKELESKKNILKSKKDQLEGKLQTIFEQLKELNCNNIFQGETMIEELEKEIICEKNKLSKMIKDIEKEFND